MGYIYKITNIKNNKCYIGVTTKSDPHERWKGHKYSFRSGTGCPILMKAFNKYGEDSFKFEVIIICFDEDLYEYEKEYILKYNSLSPNGYNADKGGEFGGNFKGKKHTEDAKMRMSIKLKEYNNRLEVKEKHRQRAIQYNKTHNIGELMKKSEKWQEYIKNRSYNINTISLSDQTRKKISEGLKKYFEANGSSINKEKHSKIMTKVNGRKVIQYSKDGIQLALFDSIISASNNTGIGRCSIQSNMSGRTKSAGGFIWKYVEKELKE